MSRHKLIIKTCQKHLFGSVLSNFNYNIFQEIISKVSHVVKNIKQCFYNGSSFWRTIKGPRNFVSYNEGSMLNSNFQNVSIFVCCFFECNVFSWSTISSDKGLSFNPHVFPFCANLTNFFLFPGSSHVRIIFLGTPYFLATFDVLFLNPPQLLFHIFQRLTISSSLDLPFFTICNCSVTTM